MARPSQMNRMRRPNMVRSIAPLGGERSDVVCTGLPLISRACSAR